MASAVEPLLNLNDRELEWKRFERFCLDLARALPEVRDAHLYGDRGEDQEGIDIHADLVDGRVRTIQCRRVARFGKTEADKTIRETSYGADDHYVWATCVPTAGARKAIRAASNWDAWGIEELSSAVRRLPRETARWLVEDHLGQAERRRVLGPDAELVLAPAAAWFARTDDSGRALRTDQPLEGRENELAAARAAVSDSSVTCVVIVGRGGIGKTRLLRGLADALPDRRMLIVREGVDVGATLGAELPAARFDLMVDDAHRRTDLRQVLATALTREDLDTVILATRPHGVPAVREQLANLGIQDAAVRVLEPLADLPEDAATRLAEHELDVEHRAVAERLAATTRDAPAILVLGARLVTSGDVEPEALVASDTVRRDILTRYKEERVGRLADDVPPTAASHLLPVIAAIQPIDPEARLMPGWLAKQIGEREGTIKDALNALSEAGLLVGSRHRRRLAPDVLADHVLHEHCVGPDGRPTGHAPELVKAVPLELLGRLMLNLAELDWRLGRAGEPRILDDVCDLLERRLVALDAWGRERHLEQLADSAPYVASWAIRLARRLLDNPARDKQLFGDHVITDADARRELVRILANAGLDPEETEAAVRLLWEIGADIDPAPSRSGGDPLAEARRLGSYRRPLHFAEALLRVAEDLLSDNDVSERHRRLPTELLSGLIAREGTTTQMTSPSEVQLGSYAVSAERTEPLRTRLRTLLVKLAVEGGDRVRPAAAHLLGEMLRQPHGYYGKPVPREELLQWRPEQLALVQDLDSVLRRTSDPLVARAVRHAVEWHARFSALRGVKTAVRRLLAAHPATVEERLADALTHSLARFEKYEIAERRRRALVRDLRVRYGSVEALLGAIDEMADRLRRCRIDDTVDPGALLGTLGRDAAWALEAAALLVEDPSRPTGAGVGILLTTALAERAQDTRAMLASLAGARDVALRRLAADHVARLGWVTDPNAPERELAVRLGADGDPGVRYHVLSAAHRLAREDPALAAAIVLAVDDLSLPQLAEEACMVLDQSLPLTDVEWQLILDRLKSCPEIDFWYDRILVERAAASWRQVLDHLFARIREHQDDYAYRATPFDGFSGDLLAEHPQERRDALDEILRRTAEDESHRREFDLPAVFWSAAGNQEDALAALSGGLAAGGKLRDAAEVIAGRASRGVFREKPDWVREQLDAAEPGEPLENLRGALFGALSSGIKQGTPGKPFPEDVELERRAREHAAASPAGSRARAFWTHVAEATAAEMRRALEADEAA